MLQVTTASIQKLHKVTRGEIWDAGKYKAKPPNHSVQKHSLFGKQSPGGKAALAFPTWSARVLELDGIGFELSFVR
jgi:hypothetical protein